MAQQKKLRQGVPSVDEMTRNNIDLEMSRNTSVDYSRLNIGEYTKSL